VTDVLFVTGPTNIITHTMMMANCRAILTALIGSRKRGNRNDHSETMPILRGILSPQRDGNGLPNGVPEMSGETKMKRVGASGEADFDTLAPCPFKCKSDPQTHSGTRYQKTENIWWVECHICGTEGPVSKIDHQDARDKWNRRATPPGYELVPEGTMAQLESIASDLDTNLLAIANAKSDGAWIKGRVSLAKGILHHVVPRLRAALTRHHQETPNAQG
jgi:hypothetical protein